MATPRKKASPKRQAKKATSRPSAERVAAAPRPPPEAIVRVLEGHLHAAKNFGLLPQPDDVLAWFPTVSTNLRRFVGGPKSPVVMAFEKAINEPLKRCEGYDRNQSDASDIRRALGKGVAQAGSILEHFIKALRDENNLPKR